MPWFLFLVASFVIAWHAWRRRRTGRPNRWLVSCLGIAGSLALAAVFWPGRFHAEKMLTELAMPLGVIWFGLLVAAVALVIDSGRTLAAVLVAAACGLLSLVGNDLVGDELIWSLERPYVGVDPMTEDRFDAVCVLGGGAWVDVHGQPKISSAGDRIVVGARLYRGRLTPLLICTGNDLQPAPNLPTVAEMTRRILSQMGTPDDVFVIAGGDTTKSELGALQGVIDEHGWQRVGIVTSAWHMPRVERLARGVNIEFVPLPADFRSATEADLPLWDKVRRFSIIPRAGAIQQTHVAVKEYLAALADR